jgi:hypothetical protein
MSRSSNLFVSAAVIGVVLAGCGGGGSKTLSSADLAKQAGDICANANKDISAVKPPTNLQDANAAAAYFGKVVPIGQAAMDKLAALKPPADDKAAWNDYVAKQRAETNLLVSVFHKAQKKDTTGLTDLQKVPTLDSQVNAAAKKAGVPGCAGG